MLGKIINSTSKYNILAPVYVCEDNNILLFIEIYIIRMFLIAYTSHIIIHYKISIIILLLLVTTKFTYCTNYDDELVEHII